MKLEALLEGALETELSKLSYDGLKKLVMRWAVMQQVQQLRDNIEQEYEDPADVDIDDVLSQIRDNVYGTAKELKRDLGDLTSDDKDVVKIFKQVDPRLFNELSKK